MRGRVGFVVAATLALVGCEAKTDNTAAAAQGQVLDPAKVRSERWRALFADAPRLVAAINEFGYALPAPKPGVTTGTPQPILGAKLAASDTTSVAVTSADGRRVDALAFALDVTHPNNERELKRSRRQLRRVVAGVLGRFEVYLDDDIKAAMRAETDARSTLPGATIQVQRTPLTGAKTAGSFRMTVTIHRPEAPTLSQAPAARTN